MSSDADPAKLADRLGSRWALAETSFKFHAACRHTHPAADALQRLLHEHQLAADALQKLMHEHKLVADAVAEVTAQVHQAAIDVLGPVRDPQTVHQAKFSMGTVLGLIAVRGRAGLTEFDTDYRAPAVIAFRDKVSMVLDAEVDSAYPARWIGKVQLRTTDGRQFSARVDEPKGDPGNSLDRSELEDKAQRLAAYQGGASPAEMRAVITQVWSLADALRVPRWLPAA